MLDLLYNGVKRSLLVNKSLIDIPNNYCRLVLEHNPNKEKMYFYLKKRLGGINITIPRVTQDRLARTCFRGRGKGLAGNFEFWVRSHNVIRDVIILRALLESVEIALEKGWDHNYISVMYGRAVGWAGTDDAARYEPIALEAFAPSKNSIGLRVKVDQTNIYAPKTEIVTIIYGIKYLYEKPVVFIRSMYPGKYVGRLVGDVSARESCVFFDWNHPGER